MSFSTVSGNKGSNSIPAVDNLFIFINILSNYMPRPTGALVTIGTTVPTDVRFLFVFVPPRRVVWDFGVRVLEGVVHWGTCLSVLFEVVVRDVAKRFRRGE